MSLLRQFVGRNVVSGFSGYLKNGALEIKSQFRTLYSAGALGLDQYVNIREKTAMHFANSQDRFKSKMQEFSDENSQHMIFTEDLKSMVHITEANENDLNIVKAMMRKFNQQNKEVRFGSFIFGPVVMRMYYYLNHPLEALEAFKDEKLNLFFDQLISYQLLMDLLFKNEMFEEVIEVFDIIRSRQVHNSRFPKNPVVLFFGACYKLNTKESFKRATDLWHDLKAGGHHPMRRATTFAAFLALKQNAPHIALEMISIEPRQQYMTVRAIKAAALADLGRPEDAVPLLRSMLQTDNPQYQKQTITLDIMERIRAAFERTTDKEVLTEFARLDKQLQAHELITSEPLDTLLCAEIAPSSNPNLPPQRDRILSFSYNRGRAPTGRNTNYRPGLAEMS